MKPCEHRLALETCAACAGEGLLHKLILVRDRAPLDVRVGLLERVRTAFCNGCRGECGGQCLKEPAHELR